MLRLFKSVPLRSAPLTSAPRTTRTARRFRRDAARRISCATASRFRQAVRGLALLSEVTAHLPKIMASSATTVRGIALLSVVAAGLAGSGCTRQKYRCKVDTEAYYLIDQKIAESCEATALPYRIEIDPCSRMFDPFNPDRPPMPEDDPQSNRFMRMVDGKKGYPLWEANGRTNTAENPQWWNTLPLDARGVLVLDMNEAVRTALLHSSSYQRNMEEVYLSALDVSSERFLLDSQFFAGWDSGINRAGSRVSPPNGSTLVSTGPSGVQMSKVSATGANLLVGFANSMTWQLIGTDNYSSNSLLNFSLIQPLLRQGGRDVVLERLTLAERALLANVRAMERYRREFYVDIATGRGPTTNPARRGGVFGGAGFGGFTGLGGGFGTLGGGGGGGGGIQVQGAQGYLGLLQNQLNILNAQENVAQLTDVYLELRDSYRELLLTVPATQSEIPTSQIQVATALQQVYSAQISLIGLQASYQSTLDNFKTDLGLPPYLCVEIRDPLLDRFKLISQGMRDRRGDVGRVRVQVGDVNTAILQMSQSERDPATGQSVRSIASSAELVQLLDAVQRDLKPVEEIHRAIIDSDIAEIRDDIDILRQAVPKRRAQLTRLLDTVTRESDMVCALLPTGTLNTSFLDGEGLEQLPDELTAELDKYEAKFREQAQTLSELFGNIDRLAKNSDQADSPAARFDEISQVVILNSQDLLASINENILGLQIVQAKARTEAALLPEVEIEPIEAVQIARANRRDWLNNRASLVNSWRAIEVVADNLESVLNLTLAGDVRNVGDNPLAFHSTAGTLRAGVAWDAPITRLQERNNYRQVLIEYQRAKRSYYQFEDTVWRSMRTTLRTVRQNQLAFEIQRFAVQNAALTIGINQDRARINEVLGSVGPPTAANDYADALNNLLNAQQALIGTFVNYEALRRSLDLDMGTMQLDAEGLWIDPGPIRSDTLGGSFGSAVMGFGLNERESEMRDRIETLGGQPIEVAPSDRLPPAIEPGDDHPTVRAVAQAPMLGDSQAATLSSSAYEKRAPMGTNSPVVAAPPLQILPVSSNRPNPISGR